MSRPVYIIAARRSIIAPRNGALAHLKLHQLAAPVLQAALSDARLASDQVDDVVCGNALGAGGNPARLVALAAGLPQHVAGLSIDRQCCSGLDALLLGEAMIASGQAEIIIAGGVESYSQRPYRAHQNRDGILLAYDRPAFTPWPERDPEMVLAADNLSKKLAIGRQQQDHWTIQSHAKALAARDDLATEICRITAELPNFDSYTRDLSTRACSRAPKLAGSITQANTAVAADGAAFCVLCATPATQASAVELVGGITVGSTPDLPGLAPVIAIQHLLQRHQISVAKLTHVEIMEAFAVQALACIHKSGLDPAQVNCQGGALARGHPIGASGAVLAVRLFHNLQKQPGSGLAAIAAAGGLGTAALMRRI